METKWTYEVLLHDMFGGAGYWYRDVNPRTGEMHLFVSPEQAKAKAQELYPGHSVRTTIADR